MNYKTLFKHATVKSLILFSITQNLFGLETFYKTLDLLGPIPIKEISNMFGHEKAVMDVEYIKGNSKNNKNRFVSVGLDRKIIFWEENKELNIFEPKNTIQTNSELNTLVVLEDLSSKQRDRLVTGSEDGAIRIWDDFGNITRLVANHLKPVDFLNISKTQNLMVSLSRENSKLMAFNEKSAPVCQLSTKEIDVTSVFISESNKIYVGGNDSKIYQFDEKGYFLNRFGGHNGPVISLSSFNDSLISAGTDGVVFLWDEKGNKTKLFEIKNIGISKVIQLNDNLLAVVFFDNSIYIMDKLGHNIASMNGHKKHITSLKAFDEGKLVSGSQDATLRIWDWKQIEIIRNNIINLSTNQHKRIEKILNTVNQETDSNLYWTEIIKIINE